MCKCDYQNEIRKGGSLLRGADEIWALLLLVQERENGPSAVVLGLGGEGLQE